MNRLVIIGNGFDLKHGLKTRYSDFIYWYLNQRFQELENTKSRENSDQLCSFKLTCFSEQNTLEEFVKKHDGFLGTPATEIIKKIKATTGITLERKPLFGKICENLEEKGWVDVESEYYSSLVNIASKQNVASHDVRELQEQMNYLQTKLIDYLREINGRITANPKICNKDIYTELVSNIRKDDLATSYNGDNINAPIVPQRIMLLCFNYTNTLRIYRNDSFETNYIHGNVNNPGGIIFGYGDDSDCNYRKLLDSEHDTLSHIKIFRYFEVESYRNLLSFINSAEFQVFIMGHSCGRSDRTILRTIFEHKNCVSIKPYYCNSKDFDDRLVNIARCSSDTKQMLDKVVSRNNCKLL